MKIVFDHETGWYKGTMGGATAQASSRMLLVKLACGTVTDDKNYADDEPLDLPVDDPSDNPAY